MRMRLGILHDSAQQERMAERERKREEDKRRQAEAPTVLTELQQKKADEEAAKEKAEGGKKKEESKAPPIKIRPLSDAKAIELGANFFSEAFVFMVALSLIIFENYRSRNKAKDQREVLADRLDDLEAEIVRLRNRYEPGLEALKEKDDKRTEYSWYNPAGWWARTEPWKETPRVEESPAKEQAEPTSKESASIIVKQSQQAQATKNERKASVDAPQEVLKTPPKAGGTESAERIDTVQASSKNR